MDIIQAKLAENIQKGAMNSFERLATMLDGSAMGSNSTTEITNNHNEEEEEDDSMMMDTSMGLASGKRADKVPIKAKSSKRKKQLIPNVQGQSGSRMAKKIINKAKRRGQIKKGQWVQKSKPKVARKAKKDLASF